MLHFEKGVERCPAEWGWAMLHRVDRAWAALVFRVVVLGSVSGPVPASPEDVTTAARGPGTGSAADQLTVPLDIRR